MNNLSNTFISRNVTVAAFLLSSQTEEMPQFEDVLILAVKRSQNSAHFPGMWCLPGGHLQEAETIQQGCEREILEETGLSVADFDCIGIDDDPTSFHGNVTFQFAKVIDYTDKLLTKDPLEIEEVRWIKISEIEDYEWAFNHDKWILALNN